MMSARVRSSRQGGFTLVEVVVSVIVAALFLTTITQLYVTQSRLSSVTSAYTTADLLAYNNMRTYANGKSPTWFDCTYSGSNPLPMTLISNNDAVDGIPSPVTQTVVATAPYGCGGDSVGIGYPIRVVSTVTYGPEAKVVVHATYATY